jgi:hypothetical protein
MREEEVERAVAQAVRGKIEQFFAQSDSVTNDDNFYYVKVRKPPTLKQSSSPTPPPK